MPPTDAHRCGISSPEDRVMLVLQFCGISSPEDRVMYESTLEVLEDFAVAVVPEVSTGVEEVVDEVDEVEVLDGDLIPTGETMVFLRSVPYIIVG